MAGAQELTELDIEKSRIAVVFGLLAASQAVCIAPAFIVSAVGDFKDLNTEVAFGIALGVSPIVGNVVAGIIGKRSRNWTYPRLATGIGSYVGAAISYLSIYWYMEKDDPKVDGQYDSIYFERKTGGEVVGKIFFTILVPLILPAATGVVGYLVGRKPLNDEGKDEADLTRKAVEYYPPTLTLIAPMNRTHTSILGIRAVQIRF